MTEDELTSQEVDRRLQRLVRMDELPCIRCIGVGVTHEGPCVSAEAAGREQLRKLDQFRPGRM